MKGPFRDNCLRKVFLPMIGVPDDGMCGRNSLSTSPRSSAHSMDCHRACSFRRSPDSFPRFMADVNRIGGLDDILPSLLCSFINGYVLMYQSCKFYPSFFLVSSVLFSCVVKHHIVMYQRVLSLVRSSSLKKRD